MNQYRYSWKTRDSLKVSRRLCWVQSVNQTPAVVKHLGEEQSPVVLPAAVLAQDVGVFIHHSLLIINSSLLLIAQHRVQLPQHLEEGSKQGSLTHMQRLLGNSYGVKMKR